MSSDKPVFPGVVKSARGNGFFVVNVSINKDSTPEVLCQLSGKMRTKNIKVVEGDNVDVEIDPFDMKRGRIIYRKR